MKKFIVSVILIVPVLLQAQTDTQAKVFLDKIAANLQKNTVSTDFTVIYENIATGEKEQQQGHLKLKGRKFRFSINDMELIFDGKTQWSFLKSANEVSISEPTDDEMLQINPLQMIQNFRKTHSVQFDADNDENGKLCQLNLFPIDMTTDHFKVALTIERKVNRIDSVKIFFKNGTSTIFLTKNYKIDQTLNDADFTFNKKAYPNVEINDLR